MMMPVIWGNIVWILKKADSSVQEAGEDKYGSGQVTVQESFWSMVQT